MPELRQKAGQQNYRQTLQLGLEEDEEADELGEGADEGEGDRDFEGAESEGDHPNDEDEFEANISVNNEGSRRRRKAREGTPSRELPQRSARALQPAESYQVSSAELDEEYGLGGEEANEEGGAGWTGRQRERPKRGEHLLRPEWDEGEPVAADQSGEGEGEGEGAQRKKSKPVAERKPREVEKITHVTKGENGEDLYCLKWQEFSYRDVTYAAEEEAMELCKPKVMALKKKEARGEDVRTPFPEQYTRVDRILAKRWNDKYLVQWQALPPSEATWEDENSLEGDEEARAIQRYYDCEELRTLSVNDWDPNDVRPPAFKNQLQLRDYQVTSFEWMVSNLKQGRNVILADEMGLGKTIQCLAVLEFMRRTKVKGNAPFLLIAPLTTIPHWRREIETWTEMNVVPFVGSQEDKEILKRYDMFRKGTRTMKFNILLTSYEHARKDANYLTLFPWSAMVVDEAHRLKGENSKITQTIRSYDANWKLLMTGTPIQNNMKELYTLLNLLHPEEHSSWEDFKEKFCTQEGKLAPEKVPSLHETLKPILLRRMKEDVETIPCKEEVVVWVELTAEQRRWYKAMIENKIGYLIQGKGKDAPALRNLCMELRKVCNHPLLCDGVEQEIQERRKSEGLEPYGHIELLTRTSGKLAMLDKLLAKMKSEGQKVLVFSQFKMMLDLLEEFMIHREYEYERLDGSKKRSNRQDAIDRFNTEGQGFVFLLTTRAGGQGITLTAATTAVLYDSDWNPQSDLQAMARCHRIGQTEEVRVYRLVTQSTYEQKLFDTSSCKYGLDEAVLGGNTNQLGNPEANVERIKSLLKHGIHGLVNRDDAESKQLETSIETILEQQAERRAVASRAGNTFSQATFTANPEAPATTDEPLLDVGEEDNETFWAKAFPEKYAKLKSKGLDPDLIDSEGGRDRRANKLPEGPLPVKKKAVTRDMAEKAEVADGDEDGSGDFHADSVAVSGPEEGRKWTKQDVQRLRDALVSNGPHAEEEIVSACPKHERWAALEAARVLTGVLRRLDTQSEASMYKVRRDDEDAKACEEGAPSAEGARQRAQNFARSVEEAPREVKELVAAQGMLRSLQHNAVKDVERIDQNDALNRLIDSETEQVSEKLQRGLKTLPSGASKGPLWAKNLTPRDEVDLLRAAWKYGLASHGHGSHARLESQVESALSDSAFRFKSKGLWAHRKDSTKSLTGREVATAVTPPDFKKEVLRLLDLPYRLVFLPWTVRLQGAHGKTSSPSPKGKPGSKDAERERKHTSPRATSKKRPAPSAKASAAPSAKKQRSLEASLQRASSH